MLDWLVDFFDLSRAEVFWLSIGLIGQLLFFGRFVVQWLVSEKEGRSVMPISFWYLSLGGTLFLFAYSVYRVDPIFILGFSLNMLIYFRNLALIKKEKIRNKTL